MFAAKLDDEIFLGHLQDILISEVKPGDKVYLVQNKLVTGSQLICPRPRRVQILVLHICIDSVGKYIPSHFIIIIAIIQQGISKIAKYLAMPDIPQSFLETLKTDAPLNRMVTL